MTRYLKANTQLLSYLVFPRFLLEMKLPETAKLLYMVLLDRARLSMRNEDWIDENGNVFLYFTIESLTGELDRSETTIKKSLKALEDVSLISRRRQGIGLPNRIYVRIPEEDEKQPGGKLPTGKTGNGPAEGQETDGPTDRKVSGNKNKNSNNNTVKEVSKDTRLFGCYQNVLLSDEDIDILCRTVPHYEDYVEQLSAYMESTGKTYRSHAATIKRWAEKDASKNKQRQYDAREDESL